MHTAKQLNWNLCKKVYRYCYLFD